jgi:hypothetical protein
VVDELAPESGDDAPDQIAAAVIEPLNATVLAVANSNYDAGVSLAELLTYEGKRFAKTDANADGWLTMDELRPARPGSGGRNGGALFSPPTAGLPPRRPD